MDKKTLLLTLGAAAVVTVVGIGISNSQKAQVDLDSPLVLPDLVKTATSLNKIKIESAGNKLLISSHKEADKWVIDNLGNYDADTEKLSTLITALKNARKVEGKTAKPDKFHHLGLRDISDAESKAVLITVAGEGKEFKLLVGNSAKAGTGQYVRLAGESQTWLINKAISKPEKAEDWVNTKLFDFELDDIQSVALTGKHEYALTKADKEAKNFSFDKVPETYKLKYDSVVDSIARSIVNLKFEALVPMSEHTATPDSQKLAVKLFEQDTQITLRVSKAGEKYYAKLTGANPLWQDWAYEISEYNFNQLVKDKADFLDPLEPPKAQEILPAPSPVTP
jgi:hypothetical protein